MKKSKLFDGIKEEEIAALLDCLSAKPRKFEKNDFVFTAGDSPAVTGIVLEGRLQILKEDYWGNRTIIDALLPGDVFGETFSCAEMDSAPVSVMAVENTSVLILDYQKLTTTCSTSCQFHTRVIRNMMKILAEKNINLMQKIEHITKRTTRDKLLSYLSAQALMRGSSSFIIPFNRQELADYLSVDRSAMSAELCKMRDSGLIQFQKNRFSLLRKG